MTQDTPLAACGVHLDELLAEFIPAGARREATLLRLAKPDEAYRCKCREAATWYIRLKADTTRGVPGATALHQRPESGARQTERKLPPGWAYPTTSARKAHYFPEGEIRSACGKYGRFLVEVHTEDKDKVSSHDCAACTRAKNAKNL